MQIMNLSLYLTTIRNILCYNLSYSSESEYGRRLQFFWILLTIDWISLIVKNNRCQVNFSVTHRNESNCGVIRFDFIRLNQINSHLYSIQSHLLIIDLLNSLRNRWIMDFYWSRTFNSNKSDSDKSHHLSTSVFK
jgi:hypothetical protein